jgi:putative ABC transport system permease protein
MNLIKMIARNMRRHLRRSILTTLTIALATFIFTFLVSVPASMDRIIADASSSLRIIVNNRTGPWYGLPERYCEQIREMPGVRGCVAVTGWPATYRDGRDSIGAFAEGLESPTVFPDYKIPPEAIEIFRRTRRAALVGSLLMKKEHWKRGQEVMLRGESGHMQLSFVIAGEIPSKHYPNVFVFRRDYLREARKAAGESGGEDAWFLMARVDNADHISEVAREIDDNFRNSDFETRTMGEGDAIATGLSAIGNIRAIAFSLGAVVLLTMMLIAANSMALMVRDRLSEVGLIRTLGFSHAQVGILLFGECTLIGIIGGALGAGLALWIFGGGLSMGAILGGSAGYLQVTPDAALAAVVIATVVSILSGALPVINALRIPPALALREVV